jgi:hypothetical protein
MALGSLLVHELAPEQLRGRTQATERDKFTNEQFTAYMAGQRAEMEAAKTIRNMQLNAQASAARQIAQWYASDHAQQAITATAMQNAPALLRAIGVNIDDVPDVNDSGDFDLEDFVAYLIEERLQELQAQSVPDNRTVQPSIDIIPLNHNGHEAENDSPNFTQGRKDGR